MIEIQVNEHGFSILDSIVVSIPACHAGDRGSIPRLGELFLAYCFSHETTITSIL